MLTLKVPQTKEEIKSLYEKNNIAFGDNSSAVVARSKDEVLGYCLFELYEKGITILYIEPTDDLMLADGILRSALHVAAERSAMDARYAETADESLFERLFFIKNKQERKLDIDKLFGGCCSCEKN